MEKAEMLREMKQALSRSKTPQRMVGIYETIQSRAFSVAVEVKHVLAMQGLWGSKLSVEGKTYQYIHYKQDRLSEVVEAGLHADAVKDPLDDELNWKFLVRVEEAKC